MPLAPTDMFWFKIHGSDVACMREKHDHTAGKNGKIGEERGNCRAVNWSYFLSPF